MDKNRSVVRSVIEQYTSNRPARWEHLGNKRVNCGKPKQRCMVIRSQATWEHVEGSETRTWSQDLAVKSHECAPPRTGDDIVRYSWETRRVRDKELG